MSISRIRAISCPDAKRLGNPGSVPSLVLQTLANMNFLRLSTFVTRPARSTAHWRFQGYARVSTSTPASPAGNGSFEEPTRPGVFYHIVQAPNPLSRTQPAFALSFLPTPPKSTASSTIVGFLPAEEGNASDEGLGLHDFKENRAFLDDMRLLLSLTFLC